MRGWVGSQPYIRVRCPETVPVVLRIGAVRTCVIHL